ncbi:hypothetical protein ACFWIO_11960 [Streptomyces diastatochromogenes]|uniref:hypothetical protein n=1 Tax=Streptomyces diastatochromogenes TaxID=42236 RepID=UPI003646E6AA
MTPGYVRAAEGAGILQPDGMPDFPTWSVSEHLDLMDSSGVRTSVLPISSPGTHFGDDRAARALTREVNEFAADVVRTHQARFGHFAWTPAVGAVAQIASVDAAEQPGDTTWRRITNRNAVNLCPGLRGV